MSTIGKSNAICALACIKGSVSDFSLLSIPPRIKKYLIALRSQNFFIGRENGVFQQNRPFAAIGVAEKYACRIAAFRLQADVHFLEVCIAASDPKRTFAAYPA